MLDWVSGLRGLGRAMCLFRRPLRFWLPRLRQLVLMTVMAPAEETREVVQVAVSERIINRRRCGGLWGTDGWAIWLKALRIDDA